MADQSDFDARKHVHIPFDVFRDEVGYSYPKQKMDKKPLREDYAAHAQNLLDQLAAALGEIPGAGHDNRLPVEGLKPGKIVEVGTMPPQSARSGAVKLPKNFEFPQEDVVVLRSDRRDDRTESALIFVPDDARAFLRGRLQGYGKDPGNQARQDLDRFERIETIQSAAARSLFVGPADFSILPMPFGGNSGCAVARI